MQPDSKVASVRDCAIVFAGVSRGPGVMRINGALRPAYEWCEIFGHVLVGAICNRCGGLKEAHDGD